jgi:hypothetical protein
MEMSEQVNRNKENCMLGLLFYFEHRGSKFLYETAQYHGPENGNLR